MSRNSAEYRADAKSLLTNMEPPREGINAGDHPPITPTVKSPQMDRFSSQEEKLYDFIVRYFFATISCHAEVVETCFTFESGDRDFNINGREVKSRGFTQFIPEIDLQEKIVPNFKKGDNLPLKKVDLIEKLTASPEHFTESDMVG